MQALAQQQKRPWGRAVKRSAFRLCLMLSAAVLALSLAGCGGSSESAPSDGAAQGALGATSNAGAEGAGGATSVSESDDPLGGETSGPAYSAPAAVEEPIVAEAPKDEPQCAIDASCASKGYVSAAAVNSARLKLQVSSGDMSYNYDLPGDGTPIVAPLNMGNGDYEIRIMQNTQGNNYVEIAAEPVSVALDSEFEPYLRPNQFCNYRNDSQAVAKARELAAGAANQGDVVRAVYSYIVQNVTYDTQKAKELADATGYVPNPDETLATEKGICFDYASLAAAMLRSLGIPCQIVTGYVSPDNIYHAWNMVYIDGSWSCLGYNIGPNAWTRMDLTFAASDGGTSEIGDGTNYTDRYVY
ncbi:transglutaminase-like domain-containing protein [Xiamenia xianingshaonis]|uniref:transglutaminase-like domain-containing protein n=1 Tax=Xiamenia xianingshaonis TaxID=2682776 RepID=UPI0028F6F7CA|nr:transglutaminase-like domain-containing protein [Xiamenia xianingshaonis]